MDAEYMARKPINTAERTDYRDQVPAIYAIPGVHTVWVSNEYSDDLKARIARTHKVEKGFLYIIEHAQTYSQRAEAMKNRRIVVAKRNHLMKTLKFIEAAIAMRVEDIHNNINRFCSVPGDKEPRSWRVVFSVGRNEKNWPQYLVRHIRNSDEFRIVSLPQMMNLY